jgi:transcriptional regulator
MYQPKAHEITDTDTLHHLIQTHPFGSLVTLGKDGLTANHIPFLIDSGRGEHGTLRAHVARANPVWQNFSATTESLIIFQGLDAYISPTWYPSKHQTGKAVPTWNYAVVHAHGLLTVHEDPAWIFQLVSELTNIHESSQQLPWKVTDAPKDYIDKLLGAIVGIEIPITRLEGKWKMSQNRSDADRLGVAAGLQSKNTDASIAAADMVLKSLRG